MVDLSHDASDNKKNAKVSHDRDAKKTWKGLFEEAVPKLDKGPSSKEKKEKIEIELTSEENMKMLKIKRFLVEGYLSFKWCLSLECVTLLMQMN